MIIDHDLEREQEQRRANDAAAWEHLIEVESIEGTAEEQWSKIAEFVEISGLEPAYIIHSGSKSYHPHWKESEHLPIAQTIYLRQLICIALNADTAIANPHQPMRLAGFYRREKGREQTLEYSSEARSLSGLWKTEVNYANRQKRTCSEGEKALTLALYRKNNHCLVGN